MKSKRETWINKLETMILELAGRGEEYAHVHSEMMSETDKLLSGDDGGPEYSDQSEVKLSGDSEGNVLFKEMHLPHHNMFHGIKLGDTLRVLATEKSTPDKLRSMLGLASKTYNEMNGVNHIYESHKDEFGIKFKRVG